MDEGFDAGAEISVDIAANTDVDTSSDISLSESIEPIDDISVETLVIDSPEPPISEVELSELQNEAETLDIQPLDDGIEQEQAYEPSALSNILTAGAEGAEPSTLAQISGEIIAPPGAGEAVAQGLQMGTNAAVAGSREFMEATINQHGKSPSVEYNETLIQQAIDEKPKGE
jgi:hypothetical protein